MGYGYAVYFSERPKNRVVRWEPDTGKVEVIAGEPSGADRTQVLNDPYGIAFDSKGGLVIADKQNHRICRMRRGRLEEIKLRDADGHRARLPESSPAYDPDHLWCPTSLFSEGEGTLLCTFSDDYTLYRMHQDGVLQLIIGVVKNRSYSFKEPQEEVRPSQVKNIPLAGPTGVVKHPDGTFFFIERNYQIIREYHPNRGLRCLFPVSMLDRWADRSEAPLRGKLDDYHPAFPASLALDAQGALYVCDSYHACVLRIDVDAREFRRVLQLSRKPGYGDRGVSAVAFGPDGTAWTADSVNSAIQGYRVSKNGEWSALPARLTEVAGRRIELALGGMGLVTGH